MQRCRWATDAGPLDTQYHDVEWGVPVHENRRLFEFLLLEGAQAGLSWTTILKKRGNYRRAFADFDAARVARFNKRSVERLMGDTGIVRNRLKIESAVSNAKAFLEVTDEFGSFDAYIWRFVNGTPLQTERQPDQPPAATTPLSDAVSRELKQRGFRFVGPTICHAFMQAVGLVNDHSVDCFRHRPVRAMAR